LSVVTPRTLAFTTNTTMTVDTLHADGATLTGSSWNLVKSDSTDVIFENITLQGSHASPEDTWYATGASVDQGGNTGWRFCDPEHCAGSTHGRRSDPEPESESETPSVVSGSPETLTTYNLEEGDLISNSSDPDVYIVNSYGYKRLFLNPIILSFYGHLGGFQNLHPVPSVARDALPTSGLFRNCETGDQSVYAVEVTSEDGGVFHHVQLSGEAAVTQDPEFFKKVFCINTNEFNWYPQGIPYTSLSQVPVYVRE
jgi:hypothetical protein